MVAGISVADEPSFALSPAQNELAEKITQKTMELNYVEAFNLARKLRLENDGVGCVFQNIIRVSMYDDKGDTTGYAISVTTADGYHGNITLAVGIDDDGSLNGISFTELNETAGLGMRVDEDEFKNQFADVTVERFKLNKAGGSTADDEIDSVSGASTTSGAVVNAVNAALDFYKNTVKGGA